MTTAPIALSIARPWTSRSSPRRGADTSHVSESQGLDALRVGAEHDLGGDVVSLGFVKNVQVPDGTVGFTMELTTPACPERGRVGQRAREAVSALPGVGGVDAPMPARVGGSS